MDDDAENRLLLDVLQSHFRFCAQFFSLSSRTSVWQYARNFLRLVFFKNEFLLCALLVILTVLIAIQFFGSRGNKQNLLVFFPTTIRLPGDASRAARISSVSKQFAGGKAEQEGKFGAAFALQGRRGTMEDRFVIRENLVGTGVHFYAVFDGHGGTFSAEYAQQHLLAKLEKEIAANPGKFSGKTALSEETTTSNGFEQNEDESAACLRRSVNLVKLIKSEIAATDKELLAEAKKNGSYSGTTALVALQNEEFLVVGNVGDSRGVMCCNTADGIHNSIPLSYDHKPDTLKEKRRIEEAGGGVIFNGVWRVQGVLAVSRALGDAPFKTRNLVISDPDVLCFPLNGSLDPQFYILASDGLWDVFTNEEVIEFAQERFAKNETPAQVAKELAMEGVARGSMDNVSVLAVLLPGAKGKRRKSLSSPALLGLKARSFRRIVSSDEMEQRLLSMTLATAKSKTSDNNGDETKTDST